MRAKECPECGCHFVPDAKQQTRLTCSPSCAEEREKRRQRLKNYSLTINEYDALWESQNGRCAICGKAEERFGRRLAIDHDHTCCSGSRSCGKCVRGLLCTACNVGLGSFSDNPRTLRKAIDYLEIRAINETGFERLMNDAWGTAWVNAPQSAIMRD